MINIAGASEGRIAPLIGEIADKSKGQKLIVVSTYNRAKRLQTDLSFFSEENILILPPEDDTILQYESRSSDTIFERINILSRVSQGEECTVIAPVTGVLKKLPPAEDFIGNTLTLSQGEDIDLDYVKSCLQMMGYERVPVTEAVGEYSLRGGIFDIFPPDCEFPVRIELFDTEIDSIRTFDSTSQRSMEPLESVNLCPCCIVAREEGIFKNASKKLGKAYDRQIKKSKSPEIADELSAKKEQLLESMENMVNLQYPESLLSYYYDETNYLWDYMDDPIIFIDDPARILESLEVFVSERANDIETLLDAGKGIKEDFAHSIVKNDFFKLYDLPEETGSDGYIFTPFVSTIKNAPFLQELRQVDTRQMSPYNGRMDIMKADVESYTAKDFTVTIVCATDEKSGNIREYIEGAGFSHREKLKVETGIITGSMELTYRKECFIWEGDIFSGRRASSGRKRRKGKSDPRRMIRSFADVKEGDYVVHENHGIGKFMGVEPLVVQGVKKDYLKLKYAGTDSLYIPVEQLNMLQKYIGGGDGAPKLNRLSGNEWKAAKAKAQAAVTGMAEDLIKLSATRMHEKGYAFEKDTPWQKEFEDSFPYCETEDQLKCIDEIKSDMERDVSMDRLLCGDVGFGKTEVAARALFKCAAEGKQAAVLVPTTLLANQHYYTLRDRFEKFPFKVEMLSRFRSPAQQKQIIEGLAAGSIDLVIGTHRLLSEDIKFKDLGLLVVDEEQRFGVKHKERIKMLKENVDVLTLSATPIPRTLHMSLSGIKDISTIEEPPEDRYPVQTYVMEQDDFVIREAVEREMARGGQVFILYNRVASISTAASRIRELVPSVRVAVGHGKMSEDHLEDVIMDFAAGEYDVLVSTTIIESGMDIPNANTMIIIDADRFGLAQLYQLRGRVGRSGRVAYAYLMYRKNKNLSEIAEKRLNAIKDFTEFGSGFKIAMKDLELRGAGNLLGTEQSGHMLNVGYELYCKLLEDAVKRLSAGNVDGTGEGLGEPHNMSIEDHRDETAINLPITAVIPKSYISDEVLRLQMYKKIALIRDEEDELDVTDELIDRFGDIPEDTMNLVRISKIRKIAESAGVREISQEGYKLKLAVYPDAVFPEGLVQRLIDAYGEKIKFFGGKNPYIRLTVGAAVPTSATGRRKYVNAILKEMDIFFKMW